MKKNRLDKNRGTAKRRRGMLEQWHAKLHRLPAHLTGEDEWQPEQSGVRLSRVFGMVLGIHVVAIGGLMMYEKFRHQEGDQEVAMKPAAREITAPVPTTQAATGANPVLDNPANDGLRRHVVAPGERLSDIAARYGVEEKVLQEKNLLGLERPLALGMELVIPNRQVVAMAPTDEARLPARISQVSPGTPSAATLPMVPVASRVASADDGPENTVIHGEPPFAPDPAPAAATKPKTSKPPAKAQVAETKKTTPKPAAPAAKPAPKGRVHVVKNGETAYGIARIYRVNVDRLVKENGIKPTALRPGTKLVIPASR